MLDNAEKCFEEEHKISQVYCDTLICNYAVTAAAHDPSSEGLRDAPSTPVRGKAAKRRRVLCSPACVTRPPLAAPRVERDAASCSSPEAYVPQVSVAGFSGGHDDADPDDPVGLLLSLLDCPPRRALRPGISGGHLPPRTRGWEDWLTQELRLLRTWTFSRPPLG